MVRINSFRAGYLGGASTPLYSTPSIHLPVFFPIAQAIAKTQETSYSANPGKVLESVDSNDIVTAAVFQSFPKRQWRFDNFHGKAVDTCSTTSIRPILLHTIQPDLAI